MSDNQTTDEANEDNESNNWRRNMEQQLREAQARADKAEKENAFNAVKGLDPANASHKFFIDKYEGELSKEAIEAAAQSFGFIKNEQEQQVKDDIQKLQRIDEAGQGASPAEVSLDDADKLAQILNGKFDSLDDYNKAVTDAGYAQKNNG